MKSIKINNKYEVYYKNTFLGTFSDWKDAIPKAWELAGGL